MSNHDVSIDDVKTFLREKMKEWRRVYEDDMRVYRYHMDNGGLEASAAARLFHAHALETGYIRAIGDVYRHITGEVL